MRIRPVMRGMLGMLSPESGRERAKTVFLKVFGGRKRGTYGNLLSRQAATVLNRGKTLCFR